MPQEGLGYGQTGTMPAIAKMGGGPTALSQGLVGGGSLMSRLPGYQWPEMGGRGADWRSALMERLQQWLAQAQRRRVGPEQPRREEGFTGPGGENPLTPGSPTYGQPGRAAPRAGPRRPSAPSPQLPIPAPMPMLVPGGLMSRFQATPPTANLAARRSRLQGLLGTSPVTTAIRRGMGV